MNMKKKIRKAFHAATPNVLGRILDDCPTAERKAAVPASPAPEKQGMPHWTRELIATAAAFALLIAVAGGAYVYIRSLAHGTGNENPTGISTDAPSHSDPTHPISNLQQELENTVRAMVCPEGMAANYVGYGLEVDTELLHNDLYLVTAHYSGYTYEFTYTQDGKLTNISIPLCDCVKDGYISELVAQEIVKLSFLSDPDMVGIHGCSLVTMNDVPYYHISGNIMYMSSLRSFYVNATTGELSTPDITIPDGNIGVDLAVETALDSVDLHRDAVKNLSCVTGYTKEGNLCYVVTFVHGSTLYEIGVGAYNPSVLYCNSTAVTPITESQALQIAQEHLSAHLADMWHFEVVKDIDGGYSIHYGVDSIRGTVVLDRYGYLQSILNSDDPVTEPSNAEDRIGWRVARDIALAVSGMELEEVRSLSCRFVYKTTGPSYYEITIDGDIIELVEAQSGWIYYEGDGDGSPSYDTTIITRTDALTLVLQDIGGEVAEKWLNGDYAEGQSECVLRYVGGDPGRNQTKLEYTITVWIEDYTYEYRLDAYTGTIREKSVGDDTVIPGSSVVNAALESMGHGPENSVVISCDPCNYNGTDCYTVRFFADGRFYEVVVDAATGKLQDHFTEDQNDILATFNARFGDYNSYYNWALNSYYDDPTKLDLAQLFQNAKSDGYSMPDVAWYESWYQSLPEYEKELDHNFIPNALMDAVLQEYFGVALENMGEECYAGLTQIPLVPSWYSCVASDWAATEDFRALGMIASEDESIMLYYSSNNYPLCVVTLRLTRNSEVPYQIVSNLPVQ